MGIEVLCWLEGGYDEYCFFMRSIVSFICGGGLFIVYHVLYFFMKILLDILHNIIYFFMEISLDK